MDATSFNSARQVGRVVAGAVAAGLAGAVLAGCSATAHSASPRTATSGSSDIAGIGAVHRGQTVSTDKVVTAWSDLLSTRAFSGTWLNSYASGRLYVDCGRDAYYSITGGSKAQMLVVGSRMWQRAAGGAWTLTSKNASPVCGAKGTRRRATGLLGPTLMVFSVANGRTVFAGKTMQQTGKMPVAVEFVFTSGLPTEEVDRNQSGQVIYRNSITSFGPQPGIPAAPGPTA